MHSIKLTIPGSFWDSHVYAGKLYIFGQDSSVQTIDWDSAVEDRIHADELTLAMKCAFSQSNYLYHSHFAPLVRDPEIFDLIERKFRRLADTSVDMDETYLQQYTHSMQDTPFPFPHADARIYAKTMFVAGQDGLFNASCGRNTRYGISTRPEKRWDAPTTGLSAYSNTLAVAACEEGLWESRIDDTYWDYADESGNESVRQVTKQHCNGCDWAYYSIYGKSHVNNGFLASFDLDDEEDDQVDAETFWQEKRLRSTRRIRSFKRVVKSTSLFGSEGYSWAFRERIYQATPGKISVMKYAPWEQGRNEKYEFLETINVASWKGEIVSAGVAVFGTIMEFDNAIVLHLSNGEVMTLPGEPLRWRVFPRSRHYENQLHVIYRDRLEIWSFNHDYFVDQRNKKLGIAPYLR